MRTRLYSAPAVKGLKTTIVVISRQRVNVITPTRIISIIDKLYPFQRITSDLIEQLLFLFYHILFLNHTPYILLKKQTAVTVYLKSEQLLLFAFALNISHLSVYNI